MYTDRFNSNQPPYPDYFPDLGPNEELVITRDRNGQPVRIRKRPIPDPGEFFAVILVIFCIAGLFLYYMPEGDKASRKPSRQEQIY